MKKLIFIISLLFSYSLTVLYAQDTGTGIGNIAPEIRLPSPAGDTIALSSLKGKMVLIDFWATWCAPCAKEQPELAVIYGKYKDATFTRGKGFEIYGVSLDSKKANWESMIQKVGMDWIQVSDLKFWSSPVAKLYNLQELPFNLLIDGNGVILAINLHGDALGDELAKYLAK